MIQSARTYTAITKRSRPPLRMRGRDAADVLYDLAKAVELVAKRVKPRDQTPLTHELTLHFCPGGVRELQAIHSDLLELAWWAENQPCQSST